MTADDRLAPVTPLFGAGSTPHTGSDEALQGSVSRHPAGTGRGGRRTTDEWSAGLPGADEVGAAGGAAGIDLPGDRGDATAGGGADSTGTSSGRPALRALPTYAAFAATTEAAADAGPAAGATSAARAESSARTTAGRGTSAAEPSAFVRDALDTRSPAERRTDARIAARKQAEAAGLGPAASDRRPAAVERRPAAAQGSGRGVESATDDPLEVPEAEETFEAAKQRAENISLHALSRRGVSSVEMARILTSRDLPDEVVALEIERLERVGLLDDTELAENLVRSKQERKGLGKGAITAELRQRGVAQEAIEAAIAEIDDDDEQARCDEWAAKRVGQLRGLDHATAERRLNGYLMRRGYRSEVIRRSIEKALPKGGSGGGVRFR